MAKTSMLEREKRRIKLERKYREKRRSLKLVIKSSNDIEEVMKAQQSLSKLPVNSNPVRHNRRCLQCGRPHAVYRKFGLCRICLRQQLVAGNVTGGRKSSW